MIERADLGVERVDSRLELSGWQLSWLVAMVTLGGFADLKKEASSLQSRFTAAYACQCIATMHAMALAGTAACQ